MKDRKGFLTPEQEQIVDDLIFEDGLLDAVDGIAIRAADNKGLQKVKEKLVEKYSGISKEVIETTYEVIDTLFDEFLKPAAEAKKAIKKAGKK